MTRHVFHGPKNVSNSHHFSKISMPFPDIDWFIKMKYVCRDVTDNWTVEPWFPFYNMYPLKFENSSHNEAYFHSLQIRGVGGPVDFAPISEHKLYHTKNITFVPGKTLMPECIWHSGNPAHFLFPLGILFEWGISPPTNLPTFDRLALIKCPSWIEYVSQWDWAQIVLETSLQPLAEKGYFGREAQEDSISISQRNTNISKKKKVFPPPPHETHPYPHVFSPVRPFSDPKNAHVYCFETLFLEQRWGTILDSPEYANMFRERSRKVLAKRYPEWTYPPQHLTDEGVKSRCQAEALRIFILSREEEDGRLFRNLDDVRKATAMFTSKVIMNVSKIDTFPEQVERFNSFDILVTSTGSHITNLLFTNRSNVAVLEVGLAIRDWFWRDNAFNFGIKHYFYSHIGHVADDVCYKEGKVDSLCKVHSVKEDTIVCTPRGEDRWHPIGDCSFHVDIDSYKRRLQKVIEAVCTSSH